MIESFVVLEKGFDLEDTDWVRDGFCVNLAFVAVVDEESVN